MKLIIVMNRDRLIAKTLMFQVLSIPRILQLLLSLNNPYALTLNKMFIAFLLCFGKLVFIYDILLSPNLEIVLRRRLCAYRQLVPPLIHP
jgi:hypothetical protein